jgi:3',5'-cyclic-AMP phosphodiesterase
MAKIIWMSDLHFAATGLVAGLDPRQRVQAAIDHVNRHHSDADLCVISGDLVNDAALADYSVLHGYLDGLAVPFVPMVGNHDARDGFCAALPVPADRLVGFVQFALPVAGARVLCLDTLKPGSAAGEMCEARLGWVRAQLSAHPDDPTIVFLHHPPMALGLPMQDIDRLQDGEALLDLLTAFGNVRFICAGHVHRPVSGSVRGIPYATMRSVLIQAPAPRPQWDWGSFSPADEAPAIGVINVDGNDVNLHYIEFA